MSIRGTSYYTFVGGGTWTEVEALSISLGGNLVAINDSEENQWLHDNNFHGWIGFTDVENEGDWKWSNGDPVTFVSWFPGEPNNVGNEDYASKSSLVWGDSNNSGYGNGGLMKGVAEIPLSYFSISDLTLDEGESGKVTISRTGGTNQVQNLTITSSDGTATFGSDYRVFGSTAPSEIITFSSGETSKTINISALSDTSNESDETFNLTLSASESDDVPAQMTDSTALITIQNIDGSAPVITGPSNNQTSGTSSGITGSTITINENSTTVYTFAANETVTWDFDDSALYGSGGRDVSKFSINSSTGALTFSSVPDYETPTDYNSDNDYVVVVRATDSLGNQSLQPVTVTIANVDDELTGSPLTGSISQGSTYGNYEGEGGENAIKDFNLIDNSGNNTINATNKIDSNFYYYSFAIDSSDIQTGDGNDTFNIKNYRGYYAIGLKDSKISSGAGSDQINIDLIENNFYYGAFALEDSEINTGSGDDEIVINVTSSKNDAFTSYAIKNSKIELGDGDDSLIINKENSSSNLDIAISGEISYAVEYEFGAGNDTGTFTSEGYGLQGSDSVKHKVTLGEGNDIFTINAKYSALYKSNLFADSGADQIKLTASSSLFYGIDESNIYLGGNDDVITVDSSKNSVIYGGLGYDELVILGNYSDFIVTNNQERTATITKNDDGFFKLDVNDLEKLSFNDKTIFLDLIAPTISSSSPTDDATGVATTSNIVLNFSEVVDVETGNIVIYKASDDSVVETIDVKSSQVTGTGTTQITINPGSNLAKSTSYYLQIAATAFDDSSSNSYAGISDKTSLSFTTADETSPTITGPSNNQTSGTSAGITGSKITINENSTAVYTFEANKTVTWDFDDSSLYGSGGRDVSKFSINSSTGALTFSNAPDYESPGDYNSDNDYVVVVRATDSLGNQSLQPVTVSITDLDEINPSLSSSKPADNTTAVATTSNIVLNFSEAVDVETGNIVIYKVSDDSVVETIDVTSGQVTGTGSTQITINPSSDLEEQTSYYVQIAATAFDDSSSNSYAGISDKTSLSFTTADETSPTITGPSGNGGETTSAKIINENETSIYTFSADETVTWSLNGGADVSLFSINSTTGSLSFSSAPDYESPGDSDNGNDYVVGVRATDSVGNTSDQTVTVSIADVNEINSSATYRIFTSINVPQENYLLTTTAQTSNVAVGTKLYWSISGDGVILADFASGSLNGEGTVGSDGSFSFKHLLADDGFTEGYETFDIKLFSDNSLSNQVGITKSILIRDSAITEKLAEINSQLDTITELLTVGQKYSLSNIRDYDGNLHANTGEVSESVKTSYKYQGLLDVNSDGTKEAIYTNNESGRWVTASINSKTGFTDYSDYGSEGSTRVVGIYIDPLVKDGIVKQGSDYDSQRRFQNDLNIDNLTVKASGDYDGDSFQEVYWKTNDGTAYLRALMHADGNIQYANYQSKEQMSDYLTSKGFELEISNIV